MILPIFKVIFKENYIKDFFNKTQLKIVYAHCEFQSLPRLIHVSQSQVIINKLLSKLILSSSFFNLLILKKLLASFPFIICKYVYLLCNKFFIMFKIFIVTILGVVDYWFEEDIKCGWNTIANLTKEIFSCNMRFKVNAITLHYRKVFPYIAITDIFQVTTQVKKLNLPYSALPIYLQLLCHVIFKIYVRKPPSSLSLLAFLLISGLLYE